MQHLKREVPIGQNCQVDPPQINSQYAEVTPDPSDEILQWKPQLPESEVIGKRRYRFFSATTNFIHFKNYYVSLKRLRVFQLT